MFVIMLKNLFTANKLTSSYLGPNIKLVIGLNLVKEEMNCRLCANTNMNDDASTYRYFIHILIRPLQLLSTLNICKLFLYLYYVYIEFLLYFEQMAQ